MYHSLFYYITFTLFISNVYSFKLITTNRNRLAKSFEIRMSSNNNIPNDISIYDKILDTYDNTMNTNSLLPDSSIHSLTGADNLGFILWTYIAYQGLFTTSGRPAEWILPYISTVLNSKDQAWYQDFQDGYRFLVPSTIELIRIVIFSILGYALNQCIINSFNGDLFWTWSIGACLALPAALINVSRTKLPSREEGEQVV